MSTAIGSEQIRKFVYVVNDQNTVGQKFVTLGALHGKLRVVRGLDENDRVIVNGLMRARPGVKVTPLTEAQMQEMQKKQQQQKNGGQAQPKGEAPKQKDESFKSTPESGTKASEKTMAAPADKPKEAGQSAPKAEPEKK